MPGDEISLILPKTLKLERLKDNPRKAVVMWGPLVLAGDLGVAPRRGDDGDGDGTRASAPEPVALVSDRPINQWLTPVQGKPGVFGAGGIVTRVLSKTPMNVAFSPFYAMHRRTYAAYWDVMTRAELETRSVELLAETARMRTLEAATISSCDDRRSGNREKI
jgi:hypothetical protein